MCVIPSVATDTLILCMCGWAGTEASVGLAAVPEQCCGQVPDGAVAEQLFPDKDIAGSSLQVRGHKAQRQLLLVLVLYCDILLLCQY